MAVGRNACRIFEVQVECSNRTRSISALEQNSEAEMVKLVVVKRKDKIGK